MPRRFLKSDHRETLSNFPAIIDDYDVIIHCLVIILILFLLNFKPNFQPGHLLR